MWNVKAETHPLLLHVDVNAVAHAGPGQVAMCLLGRKSQAERICQDVDLMAAVPGSKPAHAQHKELVLIKLLAGPDL